MIQRHKLDKLGDKKPRSKPNRMTFTAVGLLRLKPPKEGQLLYWDKAKPGLSLLVGVDTKTFRSQYKLHGKWQSRKLGRFGKIISDADLAKRLKLTLDDVKQLPDRDRSYKKAGAEIAWAREQLDDDQAVAEQGIDPRGKAEPGLSSLQSYEAVVDQFIEQYARRRQRTWDQTLRALKGSMNEQKRGIGVAKWLGRPIAQITKTEAYDLLEGMVAEGRSAKAQITLAWLRTLWRWAYKRDIVAAPIMDTVEIEFERRRRTKIFDDDAVRATWQAAGKLDPVEAAYVKLLILLAPRKTALAEMRRSHLDDADNPTLWTTPPELVKQNLRAEREDDPRVYETPLTALAARIIKSVPRRGDDSDLVFPSRARSGRPISPSGPLTTKLIEAGAPTDFEYHAWRHTIATWLQNEGHDKFDRGLVLNHAESGVTAGYSHGYAIGRKRELLDKWAHHVARLVTPEGTALIGQAVYS